jgi:hypothetical protein
LVRVSSISINLEIGLPQVEEMKEQEGIDPRTGERIRVKVPTGKLVASAKPELVVYSLKGDGEQLLKMSRRPDGRLQLDRLDHKHPLFNDVLKAMVESSTTTEALSQSDYDGLGDAIAAVVPETFAGGGKFLPEGLVKAGSSNQAAQGTLFPVSRGRRKEDLAAAVRFFIPRMLDDLIKGIDKAVTDELARLQYLGPLRSYPPRHLAFSQNYDTNWFAGGGYAWDVVRRDAQVRNQVNAWLAAPDRLQTPYVLVLRDLVEIDQLEIPLLDNVEDITLENLDFEPDGDDEPFPQGAYPVIKDVEKVVRQLLDEIRGADIEKLNELIMIDQRSGTIVSHRDVGIGVSQVLPVLVSAYASRNHIIAIEQPEIHLHPALQADLGDVFIQSALGESKNRFLIETHSEHLLLRIMRRIRETTSGKLPAGLPPIHPEDVVVLFIEPDGTRSIVREMPLNERGELVKAWPGGFFEEGLREVFDAHSG